MTTVTNKQAEQAADALAGEIAALALAGTVLTLSDNARTRALGDALLGSADRLIDLGRTLCADRTS